MMKAYTDVDNDKQYFIEGKDSSNHYLGLYRDGSRKLCVDMNGKTLASNLILSKDTWHTVGLSFDIEVQSDSLSTTFYQKVSIYLDGSQYEFKELVSFTYSSRKFMIGRTHDSEKIVSYLGKRVNGRTLKAIFEGYRVPNKSRTAQLNID